MSRPKLNHYSYYNFQLPTPEKARLQELAQARGQTLSNFLLDDVHACDLLRKVAGEANESEAKMYVKVWLDEGRVVLEYNGRVVKI